MMRADVPRPALSATAFVEVVSADDLEHERVPGRSVERDRDALDEAEHVQLPDRDHAREREHGEQRRIHREHGLARHDHPPQVDPIGDRAADQRERGHRQRLHERERARPRPASASSWSTSQYAAICCIHVPMNEMPLPAK